MRSPLTSSWKNNTETPVVNWTTTSPDNILYAYMFERPIQMPAVQTKSNHPPAKHSRMGRVGQISRTKKTFAAVLTASIFLLFVFLRRESFAPLPISSTFPSRIRDTFLGRLLIASSVSNYSTIQSTEERMDMFLRQTVTQNMFSLCENLTNVRLMSSKERSRMELLENGPEIIVQILTVAQNGSPRTIGGDVIFVWAMSSVGEKVAGEVTDHGNGTYTGRIKVFWLGKTIVKAKIAATVENACLKQHSREKFGNAVFSMQKPWGILGTYSLDGVNEEKTRCGANPLIYGCPKLCNFTNINGGMPWYCCSPSNSKLTCVHIKSFGTGSFVHPSDVKQEEKMTISGHGVLEEILKVNVTTKHELLTAPTCSARDKAESWTEPLPSGYWTKTGWKMVNCRGLDNQSPETYRKCLKNKMIVVMGDSSIRQYAEYILKYILLKPNRNLKDGLGPSRSYHNRNVYTAFNISVTYRKHAMPFHNPNFPPYHIASIPEEILSMKEWYQEGNSLILLLHFNLHYQAYPTEQFRIRIKRTVEAVTLLITSKPNTTVLIKGPQVSLDDSRWYDPHISLLYRDIIELEFRDIRHHVIYLDVWTLTVAHNSEDIHPSGYAFKSQIHQLMSYLCSE